MRGSVQYIVGDVTSEASVKHMIAKTAESSGSLHGVVANAGGAGGIPAPLAELDTDEFKSIIDLNLNGTFYCLKHAVPLMIKAGGGSFIGMSSLAGHITHRAGKSYGVAKAAIESLIRNAADEYGEHQIRFNAIRPGLIATEMIAANLPSNFYDIFLGQLSWQDAISNEQVVLKGNSDAFSTFINFFDW